MGVTVIILVFLTFNLAFLHRQSPDGTSLNRVLLDMTSHATFAFRTAGIHDADTDLLSLHRNLRPHLL